MLQRPRTSDLFKKYSVEAGFPDWIIRPIRDVVLPWTVLLIKAAGCRDRIIRCIRQRSMPYKPAMPLTRSAFPPPRTLFPLTYRYLSGVTHDVFPSAILRHASPPWPPLPTPRQTPHHPLSLVLPVITAFSGFPTLARLPFRSAKILLQPLDHSPQYPLEQNKSLIPKTRTMTQTSRSISRPLASIIVSKILLP